MIGNDRCGAMIEPVRKPFGTARAKRCPGAARGGLEAGDSMPAEKSCVTVTFCGRGSESVFWENVVWFPTRRFGCDRQGMGTPWLRFESPVGLSGALCVLRGS